MAKFKFNGEIETVFHDLIHPSGSTVSAQPGEEIEVARTISETAAAHPELEPLDDDAERMVAAAQEKIRIEGARVFGDPAPVTITEGAPVPTAEPPSPSSAPEPTPAPAPVATEPAPVPAQPTLAPEAAPPATA